MISKTLFLVLLGTAFVLSNPIPEAGNNEVSVPAVTDEKVENVVEEVTEDDDIHPEIDFAIDDIDEEEVGSTTVAPHQGKFDKFKHNIIKWFNKSKVKLEALKKKSQKAYLKLKDRYTVAKVEALKLVEQIKVTYKEVKTAGKQAIEDFKQLYAELQSTWVTMKKTGKEAYDEVISVVNDSKEQLKLLKSTISASK